MFSAFILLLIPTAFALYHLSIQSLQPLMLLAPGAAGPHQNYAARIFLLGGAIATGWALYFGVHWTAALAVGVSGLLWYQFQFGTLHRGRGMDQVGFAHPILAAFPLMFLGVFFMVGIALVSFYPVVIGEIDWILRGQRRWLALTALAGGIFSARNLLRHVVTLQRSARSRSIRKGGR